MPDERRDGGERIDPRRVDVLRRERRVEGLDQASCARRQIAWPRLSRTELMQVAQAGRPGDPREREQDIFENLSEICLCGERLGAGTALPCFRKSSKNLPV